MSSMDFAAPLGRRRVLAGSLATALAVSPGFRSIGAAEVPVRIGVLTDMSGPLSDYSGPTCVVAAKMAAEDAGGSVLGRPIEIIAADHQNKADIGSTIARQWFDTEGVSAIADVPNSSVALAVQHLAAEMGKVTLLAGPASGALMNEGCSPTGFLWVLDTYSNTVGPARMFLQQGRSTWFLIVADYAYGHQMQSDLTAALDRLGGKVLGSASHPIGNTDYSSLLIQAQASGAQVVGLLNSGTDLINCVKQAAEFGLTGKQKFFLPGAVISDVHSLGLQAAQGLLLMTGFYWDRNDESRAFGERFFKQTQRMPGQIQAGVYSAVLHYIRAIAAAHTVEGKAVAAQMRAMPVNDPFVQNGHIRPDGRLVHDFWIVEVKSPAESKRPWDYYNIIGSIHGDDAMQPLSESRCPYVRT